MKSILLTLLLSFSLYAASPSTISWQGVLTDESGNLLNGDYQITTKLYDSETGSTALWSETQTITIADGLANIILGQNTSLSIGFDEQYWLELAIDGGNALQRIEFTSVPYAMNAKKVEINSVDSSNIIDGSIALNDFSSFGAETNEILKWNGTSWEAIPLKNIFLPYKDSVNYWQASFEIENSNNHAIKGVGGNGSYGIIGHKHNGVYGYSNESLAFSISAEHSNDIVAGLASGEYGLWTNNINAGISAHMCSDSYGVYVINDSGTFSYLVSSRYAVYGSNYEGYTGYLGGDRYSVYGVDALGNKAYLIGADYAVYGEILNKSFGYIGSAANAVYGKHHSDNFGFLGSSDYGVFGEYSTVSQGALGTFLYGVYGKITTSNGGKYSVYGEHLSEGTQGYLGGPDKGAYGESSNGNYGYLGSDTRAVYGQNRNGNYGYISSQNFAVYGEYSNGNNGYIGGVYAGVSGSNETYNTEGFLGETNSGVYGKANEGYDTGVKGIHTEENNFGYLGGKDNAVYGENDNGNYGNLGNNNYGAYGEHYNGSFAILGGSYYGVYAKNSGTNEVYLASNQYAGDFSGNVVISGKLGINEDTPSYGLHLPNSTAYNEGKALAYSWGTYSDARLKTNQQMLDYGLNEILLLHPKRYNHFSSKFENDEIILLSDYENTIGLIAQELFEIIPEAVDKPDNENNELWSVQYTMLIPVLIKAMQEQQEIISNYEVQLSDQQKQNQKQQKEINDLKNKYNEIILLLNKME
jgi:hypothetical protein